MLSSELKESRKLCPKVLDPVQIYWFNNATYHVMDWQYYPLQGF